MMSQHTTEHTTDIIEEDNRLLPSRISSEIDTILLKVASRCNINCTYCYVYNMGDNNWKRQEKLMSVSTINAVCSELSKLINHQERYFSIVLHGGEPLLLGIKRLRLLFHKLRDVLDENYPISIQTNGILLTREVLNLCSEFRVSAAVSIDGPENVNDRSRVTHKGTGTYQSVIQGIELLKSHQDADFLFAGLLAVIDPNSDPTEVYQFFKGIGTPSVDFLYKDGNHSKLPPGKTAVNSVEYGNWMASILEMYLYDSDPIQIRILDDMLKVLLGGVVTKEGLGLTDFGIIIIDTDGTITKNDTLKSSFNGADQFNKPHNIKNEDLLEFLESKEFAEYRMMQRPTSKKCLNCPVLNICGGGMVLHRWSEEGEFNNPSVYCSDQLFLIGKMSEKFSELNVASI